MWPVHTLTTLAWSFTKLIGAWDVQEPHTANSEWRCQRRKAVHTPCFMRCIQASSKRGDSQPNSGVA